MIRNVAKLEAGMVAVGEVRLGELGDDIGAWW